MVLTTSLYLQHLNSMKKKSLLSLFLIGINMLIIFGCKPKNTNVNRAFYYWKSKFELDKDELKILNQNNINTLYIKYFDVLWNANLNAAIPAAKIEFKDAIPQHIQVIPVVYITNSALLKSNKDSIKTLAISISKLINAYGPLVNKKINQIQIDCDWTLSSKEKYFALLSALKSIYNNQLILSATIRLHQIKYVSETGIPPVKKGMLMYYNMGNIEHQHNNSIFNENDAEKYAPYIKQYPLPLDAVLPLFSWVKVFRNHKMHQLLNQISFHELINSNLFQHVNEYTLKPIATCNYKGITFLTNDVLVAEIVAPKLSKKAAQHLHRYFNKTTFTLALFHLNKYKLNDFTEQDIESIYTTFN